MSIVETIAAAAKPWHDFYAHSKPTSVAITWVHIAALVIGGGFAMASDRIALRLGSASGERRAAVLDDFHAVHRPIISALVVATISGVALTLSDVETFLVSPVYYIKMGLIVVLLLNGYGVMLTERKLRLDPTATNVHWKRFTFGAVASISLWLGTTLAGVMLMND